MTRSFIARRAFAALVAGAAVLLTGCGGGGNDSGGDARWRVANLTNDAASIDAYTGNDVRFSAVAANAVTSYGSIGVGSYSVKVTAATDATSILATTFTFSPSRDKTYTAVVTGSSGSARLATLLDDEDTSGVATGTSRLRVYNAAVDSGAIDVYVTNVSDITTVSATVAAAATGTVGGFRDVSSGTYRLRVTGANDPNDVRLDITGLTLASKEASTLVVTSAASSALVNATQIVQGGDVRPFKNTRARLRLIAGASNGATVAATVGGTAFGSTVRAPSVGAYTLLNAGSADVAVQINGTTVSTATRTFAAGGDYTLVASGTTAAPQVQFLTDDNRLPAVGRYRIRLVHGDANFDALALLVDGVALTGLDAVATGTTSPWATAAANSSADVEVISVSGSEQLRLLESRNLSSLGVFTVFALGGKTDASTGAALPTVELRKDR